MSMRARYREDLLEDLKHAITTAGATRDLIAVAEEASAKLETELDADDETGLADLLGFAVESMKRLAPAQDVIREELKRLRGQIEGAV